MKIALIEALVREVIQLPQALYTELENELKVSKFWELPNDVEDIKNKQSPMSIALQNALTKGLQASGMDVDVHIRVLRNSFLPPELDNIVAYAQQSGDTKGREAVLLTMYAGNISERPDIDPLTMVEEIAEVVRHELVHGEQLRKQSQSLGITMKQAEKRRQSDPTQLYSGDDNEKYFALKNEIDAFGHQIAEEMMRRYGKEKSMQILSMSQDSPDLPDVVKQFAPLKNLKNPKDRARLKSRIYSYLQSM